LHWRDRSTLPSKTTACDDGQRRQASPVCTWNARLHTPFPLPPPRFPQHRPPQSRLRRETMGPQKLQCRRRRRLDRTSRPQADCASASHRDVRIGVPSAIRPQPTARPAAFATGVSQLSCESSRQSPARYPPGYSAGVPGTLENSPRHLLTCH
jgi:hypothetical protein